MDKKTDAAQRSPWVIHPFLFAAFPILFLYAHNLHVSLLREIFGPFQVTMLIAAALFVMAWAILRNPYKAGLLVSIVTLIFFSYKHISGILIFLDRFSFRIGILPITTNVLLCLLSIACLIPVIIRLIRSGGANHKFVTVAVALFAAALLGKIFGRFVLGIDRFLLIFTLWCGYRIVISKSNLFTVTRFMNAMSGFLVVMSLFSIGRFMFNTHRIMRSILAEEDVPPPVHQPQELPDIYYLIFDEYAGRDVLKRLYFHKNTKFYDELKKRGFYIAHRSRSNYPQTVLSLASSLNMSYLNRIADALKSKLNIETADKNLLFRMICSNTVVKFLKQYGYTFAAFSPGFGFTEIRNADYYFSNGNNLTFYKDQLFRTTPIQDFLEKTNPRHQFFLFDAHRRSLDYTLSHVGRLDKITQPKFVFAHFICPHPPFVFGPDGTPRNYEPVIFNAADLAKYNIDRTQYIKGYVDQMRYLNTRILQMIDDILAYSKTPPIIILQGDHGPGSMLYWADWQKSDMQERFSILNAYLLPGRAAEKLYQDISPVNSFRLILNYYFNTEYELLPDRSYFSSLFHPYKFTDVTNWSKAR